MVNDGNFTKLKRVLVGISGIAMLIVSMFLSQRGVGIIGDYAWMGLVIAIALSCAEFMFNSNFEDMNWTILVLGLCAYFYSIYTNIDGFYSFRGMSGTLFNNFDTSNFFGGIFMDVYPELAIAWAMKESRIGDLLGNLVKTLASPEQMTATSGKNNKNEQGRRNQNVPSSIPRNNSFYNGINTTNFRNPNASSNKAKSNIPSITKQQVPMYRAIDSKPYEGMIDDNDFDEYLKQYWC